MADSVETILISDECMERASLAGFSKQELSSLQRLLSKKDDEAIIAGVAKLARWSGPVDARTAVSLLYSLTDPQLIDLEWAVRTSEGWG